MAKFEIEIPNDTPWLKEYVPVGFDSPHKGETCITQGGEVVFNASCIDGPRLIVVTRQPAVRLKKKFPRCMLGKWCAKEGSGEWWVYCNYPQFYELYFNARGSADRLQHLANMCPDIPSNSDLECDDWTKSRFQIGEEHVQ